MIFDTGTVAILVLIQVSTEGRWRMPLQYLQSGDQVCI